MKRSRLTGIAELMAGDDGVRLDLPDLAKTLGISSAAVKSRLLRARRELKTRLAKHMGQLGPATLLAESRPHALR